MRRGECLRESLKFPSNYPAGSGIYNFAGQVAAVNFGSSPYAVAVTVSAQQNVCCSRPSDPEMEVILPGMCQLLQTVTRATHSSSGFKFLVKVIFGSHFPSSSVGPRPSNIHSPFIYDTK